MVNFRVKTLKPLIANFFMRDMNAQKCIVLQELRDEIFELIDTQSNVETNL